MGYIYVLTHESDHTNLVVEMANTNTVYLSEQGFGTSISNVFRKKGDELRFQENGFNQPETKRIKEKLDGNKVILFVINSAAEFMQKKSAERHFFGFVL